VTRQPAPAIVDGPRFERAQDGLVARLVATVGDDRARVRVEVSDKGRIRDIQAETARGWFHAGSTGSPELDQLVADAISEAFLTASNLAALLEAQRRVRRRLAW
jgi:hypothetical protein